MLLPPNITTFHTATPTILHKPRSKGERFGSSFFAVKTLDRGKM